MSAPTQAAWEAAARALYEDEYVLVATGPRRHDDWLDDLIAVLSRAEPDPRGWLRLDWDEHGEPGPPFPFTADRFGALRDGLFPLATPAAEQLLVAMLDDACSVTGIRDFEHRRDQLLTHARTLLARYGPDATRHTNVTDARRDGNPDLFARPPGCRSFTDYTMDFGLAVVSDTEIGVFWKFWPE